MGWQGGGFFKGLELVQGGSVTNGTTTSSVIAGNQDRLNARPSQPSLELALYADKLSNKRQMSTPTDI